MSLAGGGVSIEGDEHSWVDRHALMRLLAADVLDDATVHARIIERSNLLYTLVRLPRLTDAAPTGQVLAAPHLRLGPADKIGRADLAPSMLDVVETSRYLRAAPMVRSRPNAAPIANRTTG